MILQAESKREYEEVSVKESVQTAGFHLLLQPHLDDISWNKYVLKNEGQAACVV